MKRLAEQVCVKRQRTQILQHLEEVTASNWALVVRQLRSIQFSMERSCAAKMARAPSLNWKLPLTPLDDSGLVSYSIINVVFFDNNRNLECPN